MFVGEFATIWLIGKYVADFRREKVLFLTSYIDKREIRVRKDNFVLWGSPSVTRSEVPKTDILF